MSKALRYFNQNNLAADTWKSKYALRDLDDNILEDTPDDMHKRMASEFAEASKKYDNWGKKSYLLSDYGQKRGEMTEDKAYNLFKDFKHIIPQGSIMAGLGDNFRYKSLSNCLGSETKVLTRNGFTKIKHLANDSHEIMTKGGKWVEAPFKNYGEQEIVKIHLTRGKSNTKTIKATPDHRWFVNQYGNKYIEKHTEELEIGDKLKLTFGRGRGSLKPSSFGIAHGIVFGDGHTVKGENNSNNITLCEDSRQLGEYFLDDPVSSDENLCKGGSDFYGGIPNHFRDLPKLNENNQYLYGWLAGYFAADGNIDSGGSAFIASSEKENLQFVKDVCGVLGIGCGNIKVDDRISNLTEERHIMYKVCLYTQHLNEEFFILDKHKERYSDNKKSVFRWKVDSIEYTGNKEFVYCAEVPDTQSFVIEGNILTGNCVVLNDVVDSYGGICYTDQQLAQLMKRRCGVGVDISNLRPRGSTTKNAAGTSTGTVSFLKRFSDTTNEVAQEGRRGALMVTLDCRHPDIMEFISSKDAADKVTGANISVKWTEDFIEAAKNREEFTLRWPVEEDPEDADITKTVDAYEAFKQAAMYAHGYNQEAEENATTFGGDPGCMFIDRMIEYSTDCGYPGITVLSTNPCQPGFSTVRTPDGMKRMDDINEGDVIWSENQWVNVINKVETGTKPVYRYKTTAGTFYSTEDHRIKEHGVKIEISNADEIDLLAGSPHSVSEINQQSVLDGLMIGDGSYHEQSADPFYLNIGENDQDYFDDPVSELIKEEHPAHYGRANKVNTTLTKDDLDSLWNREVPDKYFYGHPNDVASFLRGLYSANGSICGKRVTLKTTSRNLVERVQEMLSSIGIRSYYTTNKPTVTEHRNGKYESRKSYDINITTDREVFYNKIGFIQEYKMNKLQEIIENTNSRDRKKSHEILEVEYIGDYPVYDITVDGESHTYWTHGFNSSNCGEIGMHNDCCRLIALNFMSAVEQPFTTNASLNFDTIEKLAYEQQILLDNLVDLEIKHMNRILNKIDADPENEKYKRIEKESWQDLRENAYKYRRTGGGFTALGDALAAVGVEYGSEHGNEVVDKMMRAKFRGEWNASIDMAIERGPFPEWNPDHDDTMFFNMMEEEFPEIYERNMEHGRRNISLSTVAPTGSVSLLANINGEYGTTSGIEPVFATEESKFWHTRGKKVSNGEDYDYVGDDGNKYKQYKVFHEGFKQYIKERYKIDPQEDITDADLKTFAKQSPYVSAAGLEVEDRIDLQSIVQKYTTHSISSTLNLPQDSEWNRTLNIYQYGYDKGLKGVTIFRNGSKMGILQDDSNDESEGRGEEITYHDAPERPDALDANVHTVRDNWAIIIGLLNDKPYEVFALDVGDNNFLKNLDQVRVWKTGSQQYELENYNEDRNKGATLHNILNFSPSSDVDVLTRFTSQLMRHGVKMDYIVEQVRKADITINDFSKILGDVLAQYTTDDYSVECEDCGSENVKFVEGCYVCQSCGSSRCG